MSKKSDEDYPAGNTRYPWQRWANGEWHEIKQGKDFDISVQSMRAQVLQYARSRNLLGKTRLLRDGETLAIKFAPGTLRPSQQQKKKKPAAKKAPAKPKLKASDLV